MGLRLPSGQRRYERLDRGDRMFKIDVTSGVGVGSVGFWTKEWRDEQVYEGRPDRRGGGNQNQQRSPNSDMTTVSRKAECRVRARGRRAWATSDKRMFRVPVMRRRERARLARLQQRLARQRKGSNRRRATKRRIAALQQTVADRRRDWIEQQTTRLVRDCDLIAVEALNVKGMVRRPTPKPDPEQPGVFLPNGAAAKAGLNRSIHQQAWSVWLRRVAEKAQASGVLVEHVSPRDTSRECRASGHVASENRESQAVFCCVVCGHEANADINAAQNILARALRGLALTPGPGASTTGSGAGRVSRRSRRSAHHPARLPHAA